MRHSVASGASDACFYSTGSVATKQSRPQPSRLQDMERRPAASVSVTGVQHWRTQASFGARLAWHGPDHHWQCNWWVAWPSSCLCAGKGWTLWTNAVTFIKTLIIQQCNNKRFICDLVLISYYLQGSFMWFKRNLNFRVSQGSVATQIRCGAIFSNICWENFLCFSAMQKFWKSIKIRQSYHEKFDAPLGHSVYAYIHYSPRR